MGGATNLRSAAWRGHRVLVAMGGPPSPGRQHYVVSDPEKALARKEKEGSFGVVTLPGDLTVLSHPWVLGASGVMFFANGD